MPAFSKEMSFASADTAAAVANAIEIPCSLGEAMHGGRDGGHQILRLICEGASGCTATLVVFVTETFSSASAGTQTKRLFDTATVAATTLRTSADGASGNYLCTTAFAISARDIMDVLFPAGGKLYVACTALASGPVYVKAYLTRANP